MSPCLVMVVLALGVSTTSATCSVGSAEAKAKANDAANFKDTCIAALEAQVKIEMEASLQYLMMGAFFTQDTVNLPNVAELFWSHADEERSHAIAFITYLRMRGATNNDFFAGQPLQPIEQTYSWPGVSEALQMALQMEKLVSGKMKEMIDICTQVGEDDPHAADWLTGTWLEEQLTGQRKLAGLINSLNTFKRGHEELAQWMFDQNLSVAS